MAALDAWARIHSSLRSLGEHRPLAVMTQRIPVHLHAASARSYHNYKSTASTTKRQRESESKNTYQKCYGPRRLHEGAENGTIKTQSVENRQLSVREDNDPNGAIDTRTAVDPRFNTHH